MMLIIIKYKYDDYKMEPLVYIIYNIFFTVLNNLFI